MRKRKKTEEKHVNFLDFEKKQADWRYKVYQSGKSETIYWIGTIYLSEVEMSTQAVHMRHVDSLQMKAKVDSFQQREDDGAEMGGTAFYTYQIDNPELKTELLAAKRDGKLFYHVFLEETVGADGSHEVNLLYAKKQKKVIRGLAQHVPLLEMPLGQTIDFWRTPILASTQRICLLSHDAYRWMK